MKILRPFFLGAGLFVFLALGAWCCQSVLPAAVRGIWNPFEILVQSQREERRSQQLDAEHQSLWKHLELKYALVDDLIAGRRSLWEAERMLQDQAPPALSFRKHLRLMYPGVGDDEALCRQIILLIEETLRDQPNQRSVVARLRAELTRGPAS